MGTAEGLGKAQKGTGDKAVGVSLDSMSVKTATSAPKKTAEGLGKAQKGTGDKAVGVSLDSMSVKSATSAPKKTAEGLGTAQKGTGDKAVGVGLDSMSVKSATSAPRSPLRVSPSAPEMLVPPLETKPMLLVPLTMTMRLPRSNTKMVVMRSNTKR